MLRRGGIATFSAFTVEICPLARLDKTGPVEGMLAALALQHRKFCLPQGFSATESMLRPV